MSTQSSVIYSITQRSALLELASSGLSRAFLRWIKFSPPRAYRMPVRGPHSLAEEHEYISQGGWLTACDPFLHPLSVACFTTNSELLQIISPPCPKKDPPHQLQNHLQHIPDDNNDHRTQCKQNVYNQESLDPRGVYSDLQSVNNYRL